MALAKHVFFFFVFTLLESPGRAADSATLERVHRISLEKYEATLQFWQKGYPAILDVERAGLSVEGLGLYVLKIRDPDIPIESSPSGLIRRGTLPSVVLSPSNRIRIRISFPRARL